MRRVIAIVNQKGGVGKTTTAINLGTGLAVLGTPTLLIDLDPQGNASSGLGVRQPLSAVSTYDILIEGSPTERALYPTVVDGLAIIPSSADLAGAEIELVPLPDRERRLQGALARGLDDFQIVLLDCPPSLGLLTINALTAATEILIPIQCEYYALEGLSQLLDSVSLVRRHFNPGLEITGVVLTLYDGRTRLADQVAGEVRQFFKDKVFQTVVPRSVRLAEAPSHGLPGVLYDPASRGAEAYMELAREVVSRGRDAGLVKYAS